MGYKAVAAIGVAIVCLAGCQSTSQAPPGLPSGASNHSSAGLTTVLPNSTGTRLTATDRPFEASAEQRVFVAPLNQQVTWNNPQTGNSGTITATRDGYIASGAYCREFHQTLVIGGQQQQVYNKACQQADGSWKIVQ